VIAQKAGGSLSRESDIAGSFGSPREIGRLFLTDHLLAFEITSIVLLVAAVGGVILGSHAREREEAVADRAAAARTGDGGRPERQTDLAGTGAGRTA
jgi:NADH-quinone oxidoreductase subunit J/NAD(P)H-quinone oxidoreductase subunit 6